jgi:Uma2 family endonuclease
MNIYTYPDASIVCGTPLFDDAERDTLLNPLMIIEILSPSTERYDRGKKFHHYQTIATLKEYMLIAQDEHRIEHYTKHDDDTWRFSTYTTLQASIPIPTIQCTIALEDIYDKVDIESISDEDDLPINNEEQP